MKLYQSPLFITATFAVVYSFYLMSDWRSGPMGWGFLAGVVILPFGILTGLTHFILKAFIKNKRTHFITEASLIALFFIWLLVKG
jgi:hypothetical protein